MFKHCLTLVNLVVRTVVRGCLVLCLMGWWAAVHASEPENKEPWQHPDPPEEYAELLEVGRVRFEFYDSSTERRQWPGLTNYELRYSYRSDNRWKIRTEAEQMQLLVTPRFHSIKVESSHKVDLPRAYQHDGFWQQPLVRHEMDHVRITARPFWEQRFLQQVKAIEPVRCTAPSNVRDYRSVSREAIDSAVEKIFRDTIALVKIRYQELDRLTSHGIRPLDEKFWDRVEEEP